MTNDTRAAFEAWYVTNAFDYERNPIGSRECGLQWASWAASRRAALEAAAKVCYTNANEWHGHDGKYACEDSAIRIRALADDVVKP